VIGNSCKLLTIVINCTIWDKHASPFGIACLLACLVCAYFYEQAPLRCVSPPLGSDPEAGDGVQLIQK
jgi:GDP-mannose transporter